MIVRPLRVSVVSGRKAVRSSLTFTFPIESTQYTQTTANTARITNLAFTMPVATSFIGSGFPPSLLFFFNSDIVLTPAYINNNDGNFCP